MRRGDLVRFTSHVYRDWGLGLVIELRSGTDSQGRGWSGHSMVLTAGRGVQLVADCFVEVVSPVQNGEDGC